MISWWGGYRLTNRAERSAPARVPKVMARHYCLIEPPDLTDPIMIVRKEDRVSRHLRCWLNWGCVTYTGSAIPVCIRPGYPPVQTVRLPCKMVQVGRIELPSGLPSTQTSTCLGSFLVTIPVGKLPNVLGAFRLDSRILVSVLVTKA